MNMTAQSRNGQHQILNNCGRDAREQLSKAGEILKNKQRNRTVIEGPREAILLPPAIIRSTAPSKKLGGTMMFTYVMTTNGPGKYRDPEARRAVINYIMDNQKMPSRCWGGAQIDAMDPVGSMDQVSIKFQKTGGVQLRQLIIAFEAKITDPILVRCVAHELAMYIAQEFQTIFAVHENTQNLHIHMVFNSVSYVDGHRYGGTAQEHYRLMETLKKILHYFHLPPPRYVPKIRDDIIALDDLD